MPTKAQTRSTNRSKASWAAGSEDEAMVPKLVVPASAFQPDSVLRISSARDM